MFPSLNIQLQMNRLSRAIIVAVNITTLPMLANDATSVEADLVPNFERGTHIRDEPDTPKR